MQNCHRLTILKYERIFDQFVVIEYQSLSIKNSDWSNSKQWLFTLTSSKIRCLRGFYHLPFLAVIHVNNQPDDISIKLIYHVKNTSWLTNPRSISLMCGLVHYVLNPAPQFCFFPLKQYVLICTITLAWQRLF